MANLPSQHPNLAVHLADSALTPLITSARTQEHLETLTTLSHTALDAHESAQRLGLGMPQRIMVEHGSGPVLLQTFLSPHSPSSSSSSSSFPNTTRRTTTPSRNTHAHPRPHQGALALAVENRGAAFTTTEAHLRGGASHPGDVDVDVDVDVYNDAEEEEEEEEEDDDDEHHAHPICPTADDDEEDPNAPPMLVGVVVAASSDETLEARRAAARLERVGREIQGRWFELQGISPGQARTQGAPAGD
ncbi:hypothetical protein RRF57_007824 [Xylaria bambusicola]|uniref:Uncharacterized protein n=1 Tax=Xylaria bambusicola TaxID=326684 RepID=A0AAN7UGT0_9PEZI